MQSIDSGEGIWVRNAAYSTCDVPAISLPRTTRAHDLNVTERSPKRSLSAEAVVAAIEKFNDHDGTTVPEPEAGSRRLLGLRYASISRRIGRDEIAQRNNMVVLHDQKFLPKIEYTAQPWFMPILKKPDLLSVELLRSDSEDFLLREGTRGRRKGHPRWPTTLESVPKGRRRLVSRLASRRPRLALALAAYIKPGVASSGIRFVRNAVS
jgi:hypothetical protein